MAYLLDTNIFIQASNEYYGFDFCPGFWDMLDQAGYVGNALSIMPIYDEIIKQEDELKAWALKRRKVFFREIDAETTAVMPQVLAAVRTRKPKKDQKLQNYRSKRRKFLNGADPFLIAYAIAHGHTIVTRESRASEPYPSELKIPNICDDFDVPYIRSEQLVRKLQGVFVLESTIGPGS